MRRAIAFALIVGLLGALSASPAMAEKKKVKPPVTFEASGSFAMSVSATAFQSFVMGGGGGALGITGTEFRNTCSIWCGSASAIGVAESNSRSTVMLLAFRS